MTSFKVGVIGYAVLVLCLFLLLFIVSGCILAPAGMDTYKEMSPAQIKAMKDLAMDPYICTTIAGPPPIGRMTSVLVPRLDTKPDIKFGPDCQIK